MSFRAIVGFLLLLATAASTASARCGDGHVLSSPPGSCCGDCDGDQRVTVDEILHMVASALGTVPTVDSCFFGCPCSQLDQVCTQVTVDEVVSVIERALNGCPCGDDVSVCERLKSLATAEEIAQTPRPDTNIEALALSLGNRLIATQDDYERLVLDVHAIRKQFPAVETIRYFEPYVGDVTTSLFITFESAAAAQRAAGGEDSLWSCVAEHYRQTRFASDFATAPLLWTARLYGNYEAEVLATVYERLPGVVRASPVRYGGDYSTICAIPDGDVWRYMFDDAGGDCPAGCTEHDLFFFAVNADHEVDFVGRIDLYPYPANLELPTWISDYDGCVQPRVGRLLDWLLGHSSH